MEEHQSISRIECLPREVLWNVIDYSPESIRTLRLTSRILLFIVDEYIMTMREMPLVRQLVIKDSSNTSTAVTIHVDFRNCALFELRLKFRHPEMGFGRRIKRCENYYGRFIAFKRYKIYIDEYDHVDFLECLKECLGMRASWASVIFSSESNDVNYAALSNILHCFKLGMLEIQCEILTNDTFKHITGIIHANNILSLELVVSRHSGSEDLIKFLKGASSLASSIDIQFDKDFSLNSNIILTDIIMDMLSRKLVTLSIMGAGSRHLFSLADIRKLRKFLTRLGKPLNFELYCHIHRRMHISYTQHDHLVQADFYEDGDGRLRIVHLSRKHELTHFNVPERARSHSTSSIEIVKLREIIGHSPRLMRD